MDDFVIVERPIQIQIKHDYITLINCSDCNDLCGLNELRPNKCYNCNKGGLGLSCNKCMITILDIKVCRKCYKEIVKEMKYKRIKL